MPLARRFTITGRVQGVFFRESTRRVAESHGICGYAINRQDGSVEVLACGEADALDQLASWLQQGPRMAEVTRVTVEDVGWEERSGFTTG
jgi:acylphosphatase